MLKADDMCHALRSRPLLALALLLVLAGVATATPLQLLPLPVSVEPVITTPLDPVTYVAAAGTGIASLIITMPSGTFGCSGSLLSGGQYMVTAAHCISDGSAGANTTVSSLTATFQTAGGPVSVNGSSYYVSPDWTGTFTDGGDLAVIRLATQVTGIPGYDIWRGADPLGLINVAGYGLGGFGAGGYDGSTYPFGTLRTGQNELEDVGFAYPDYDPVSNPEAYTYAWDFDDGTAAHDAFCRVAGVCGTGLGTSEVMIAPGDSGGPSFYGGYLAGVHSFGATFHTTGGDTDNVLNSTFGELAGDTRVNLYADWIDEVTSIPEPGSMLLFAAGLAAMLVRSKRRA